MFHVPYSFHFIRARNSLILNCSPGPFIYYTTCWSGEGKKRIVGGEGREVGEISQSSIIGKIILPRYVNMKLEFFNRKYTFIAMIKNILFEVLPIGSYIFSTCLTICGCHAKKIVALLSQTSHPAIFIHLRKK